MSELTEKAARQRMADMIYRAKLLREAIAGLGADAAAQSGVGPPSAEARGWERLANHLGADADAAGDLVEYLETTLGIYSIK